MISRTILPFYFLLVLVFLFLPLTIFLLQQRQTLHQYAATTTTGTTAVALTLLLHGIGNAGDATSPNAPENGNPLHPQRTVTLEIFNSQNQLVLARQGTVNFDQSSGAFKGTITLGTITSGVYSVKIITPQYLRATVPGIQTLTAGTTNQLPTTSLLTGDVDRDNTISIFDYNTLMGCYSDILPATNCNGDNAIYADITDDGKVNQFDFNLFIREISQIAGQ